MTAFGDKIDAQSKKVNDVQTQVDAIDQQLAKRLTQESFNENPVEKQMKESDRLSRLFKERRGTAVVKFKDTALRAYGRPYPALHPPSVLVVPSLQSPAKQLAAVTQYA